MTPKHTPIRAFSFGSLLLVLAAAACLAWWRFHLLFPPVYAGDDLFYLTSAHNGSCATLPRDLLLSTCQDRFRPLASAYVLTMMWNAGSAIWPHMLSNALLLAGAATLGFAMARRLSGSTIVGFGTALLIACTWLATYQMTQVIGPVEGLTLLFSLASVACALRADASERAMAWGWAAIACVFLSAHSHERTLVIAVWLFWFFLLSPRVRQLGRMPLLGLLAGCAGVPVFYTAYKQLVLHRGVLIGTGGSMISPKPAQMWEFLQHAVLSMGGFNRGPDYLVGREVTFEWSAAFACATVFSVLWLTLVCIGAWHALKDTRRLASLRLPLMLLLLACMSLAPALITIRLEQRWLMIPFAVLLLLPAWAVGVCAASTRGRMALVAMAVGMAGAGVLLDHLVGPTVASTTYVRPARRAAQIKSATVDQPGAMPRQLVLIAPADTCDWALDYGSFFDVYAGKRVQLLCAATAEDVARLPFDAQRRVLAETPDGRWLDVSAAHH